MLPPSTLLYTLTLLLRLTCALDGFFSAYPSTSRFCLEDEAQTSGCLGGTVPEVNFCLCGNRGNFVLGTAWCVGALGSDVVTDVYQMMETACSETKTPLTITETEFLSASNSTADAPWSSSLVSFINDDTMVAADDVIVSAKIGISMAIIVAFLVVVCITCLITLLKQRRRDKDLLLDVEVVAARIEAEGQRRISNKCDKSLLEPGARTPKEYQSSGRTCLNLQVSPPVPSYHAGNAPSPQVWRPGKQVGEAIEERSPYQKQQQQQQEQDKHYKQKPYRKPSGDQIPLEHLGNWAQGHLTHWPSVVSRSPVCRSLESYDVQTLGSWSPSPLTATGSSDLFAYCQQKHIHSSMDTHGSVSHVQGQRQSRTMRTSSSQRTNWPQDAPLKNQPYELSGTEIRSPVEADSVPATSRPDRLSRTMSATPPHYEEEGWAPSTADKPPT